MKDRELLTSTDDEDASGHFHPLEQLICHLDLGAFTRFYPDGSVSLDQCPSPMSDQGSALSTPMIHHPTIHTRIRLDFVKYLFRRNLQHSSLPWSKFQITDLSPAQTLDFFLNFDHFCIADIVAFSGDDG